MDKFVIKGPTPLKGIIPISGSKNAALPLMAAALLGDTPSQIEAVPRLHDIYTFNNVLRVTGTRVDFDEAKDAITIDPEHISHLEAPYDLVRKMRASFYMLGALLGRSGKARVSMPGGCAWGPRPVNLHLEGMKALGAKIELDKGDVVAEAAGDRLQGGSFTLEPSSVGATINLLLAAVKARGSSSIRNAAIEPDVVQLCRALEKMGAKIEGIGSRTLQIEGVDSLDGLQWRNASDRIETGTYMIAAAMHPESDITLTHAAADDLGDFPGVFKQTGVEMDINKDERTIRVKAPDKIRPVSIETAVYPGFPTDLQAQWATLMTQAQGRSTVTDNIYPDRFNYVPELNRLGADIEVENNIATIEAPTPLYGANVMSTDLRASVSLVLGSLIAQNESEVLRVYHLDRGYEQLEEKLNHAGAHIERVFDPDQ